MLGVILLAQALTVAVSGPATSTEYLPLRVADAEGYFAREGLTVSLKTTRAESGAAEALAQGQADLAATSLEAMLRFGLRTTSPAPRLIFGLTAAPPVVVMVAAAHTQVVRSVEDLPGARVGVTTPGAPEYTWFGWLLARAGVSVGQVGIASLGGRGVIAALEAGEVHAALVPEPFATRLVKDGHARLLVDLRSPGGVTRALGGPTVNAAVFDRADRRLSDRDLARFARALVAAERRIASADPEALAARLPPRSVGPREEFAERLETARGLYLPDGDVTANQVQETIAMIRAHLPLPASLKVPRPEELLHSPPRPRTPSAAPPR
jgi:NitT/TauT family transport system substrate-binding protein